MTKLLSLRKFLVILQVVLVLMIEGTISIASAESLPTNVPLTDKQKVFLNSIAPSIRPWKTFDTFLKNLRDSDIVDASCSSSKRGTIKCVPICVSSHRLTFAELFETLARQTGTAVRYDAKLNRWLFEEPAMPVPYSITIADGWHMEDRGHYVAYIPKVAPVGMDIYMMGRFQSLSDQQLKEIRNEQAITWADKPNPGVQLGDMSVKTVDGCEALYFKCKAPIEGRQWRQWAFVKNGQAFVIVSAVDDKTEHILIPDVEKMVASFHVVDQAVPFPGF